jgi:putative tryptophan/tyrosine transport system substrate-binding protein
MAIRIRRREFIVTLGGAAAWPLAARAQQRERMRRIGALLNYAADDPAGQPGLTAFLQGLGQLGWSEGVNARIDIRWGASDAERIRKYAAELVALAPDVILTSGSPATGPVLQVTRTVPIVFVQAADPVGAGFVDSLAHPGGNATGFSNFEYSMGGKWLELLKEFAPGLKRAAVVRNLMTAAGPGQFGAIQAVGQIAIGALNGSYSPFFSNGTSSANHRGTQNGGTSICRRRSRLDPLERGRRDAQAYSPEGCRRGASHERRICRLS